MPRSMNAEIESRTSAVRRFNRFYTRRIGVLHERLADTRFSLAESRLLWEFAHRDTTTAAELARELNLDPGYLSRLLQRLKAGKLIRAERSSADARHLHLSLTATGKRALVAAMATIEALLGESRREPLPWLLRPPRHGDIGWVVARHGVLYAQE